MQYTVVGGKQWHVSCKILWLGANKGMLPVIYCGWGHARAYSMQYTVVGGRLLQKHPIQHLPTVSSPHRSHTHLYLYRHSDNIPSLMVSRPAGSRLDDNSSLLPHVECAYNHKLGRTCSMAFMYEVLFRLLSVKCPSNFIALNWMKSLF